jgi:hypothetical protein
VEVVDALDGMVVGVTVAVTIAAALAVTVRATGLTATVIREAMVETVVAMVATVVADSTAVEPTAGVKIVDETGLLLVAMFGKENKPSTPTLNKSKLFKVRIHRSKTLVVIPLSGMLRLIEKKIRLRVGFLMLLILLLVAITLNLIIRKSLLMLI